MTPVSEAQKLEALNSLATHQCRKYPNTWINPELCRKRKEFKIHQITAYGYNPFFGCQDCEGAVPREIPEWEPTKLCRRCGTDRGPLPLTSFNKNPATSDKHDVYCVSCKSEQARKRRIEARGYENKCLRCHAEFRSEPTGNGGYQQLCPECRKPKQEKTTMKEGTTLMGKDHVRDSTNMMEIDFEGYKELFDQVHELAKQQFRTPQLQILYMINDQMNKSTENSWS